MKAIIAGAGIGGLTAAIAMAQRGWDVVVFERQNEVRAMGAGLYIWENGLRVLESIGLGDVTAGAFRGLAFEQRDRDDRIIDPGELPPDLRLKTVVRKDLAEGLKRAAQRANVEIRTSAEIIGASAAGEFYLPNGKTESADVAIGADGIWSSVRRTLGLELVHEQTIEGGHRAIIRGTQLDLGLDGQGKYIEVWSGERRFLITPINEREIYLALTCPGYDQGAKEIPLNKPLWREAFPRWVHLIDRIDTVLPWSPYSIIKVKSWSAGLAAILGDAAHAQPPNLGQGGGMAMQAGLALAVHLEGVADRRDIPERLQAWERALRPLVDHCQKWSCLYAELAFLPDEFRSRTVGKLMTDPWIRAQFSKAAASVPIGTEHARDSNATDHAGVGLHS